MAAPQTGHISTPHTHQPWADSIARPLQEYSRNLPVQPRIALPPPPSGDTAFQQLDIGAPNFLPPDIAQAQLQRYDSQVQNAWTYNNRHEAQYVLPYLLLGPMSSTKDERWLRQTGITLAIGVKQGSGKLLDGALTRCQQAGIETHSVSVTDLGGLLKLYAYTARLIMHHLNQSIQADSPAGKVLIFCESGNEKSAAVAAAFLMASHDRLDHIKAMQICQMQRFCCNYVETAKNSLQCYWDILIAERGSGTSMEAMQAQQKHLRPLKRSLDQDDDMSIDDDGPEISARRAVGPFADTAV